MHSVVPCMHVVLLFDTSNGCHQQSKADDFDRELWLSPLLMYIRHHHSWDQIVSSDMHLGNIFLHLPADSISQPLCHRPPFFSLPKQTWRWEKLLLGMAKDALFDIFTTLRQPQQKTFAAKVISEGRTTPKHANAFYFLSPSFLFPPLFSRTRSSHVIVSHSVNWRHSLGGAAVMMYTIA